MTERSETASTNNLSVHFPRALMVLLTLAAATVTIAGMRSLSGLIGPAFLALTLTIAAHPLRAWLVRKRMPGWLATVLVLLTIYLFLLGFAAALVVATARFATLLPSYADEMNSTVNDMAAWLKDLGVDQKQIEAVAGSFDVGKLANFAGDVLGSLLDVVGNLFFIVTLILFLVVDASWFPDSLDKTSTDRRPLVTSLVSFAKGTRSYLIVSTVFGAIVAVIDTAALALMGIPAPLLWGLLAFLTNYIPNIGFIIGLVPVAILGLLEGGVSLMLGVIAVYSAVNVVIQSIIQPKVVGDAVGLSASLTFLSLVFWAWVLGALGALLAIPLSLLAKALLVDIDPDTRWLNPLLGDRARAPEETPPVSPP